MRRISLALPALIATACSQDPLRFIPQHERQVLQAEARLAGSGTTPQPGNRISVDQLLAQARDDQAPPAAASPPGSASAAEATPSAPRGSGISVEQLLAQAREAPPPGPASGTPPRPDILPVAVTGAASAPQPEGPRLALRYTGDEVQPNEAQRAQVAAFARRTRGASIIVSARSGGDLLGPRRALAVARLLQPGFPDIDMRFDPAVPPDEVSLVATRAPPEPEPR